MLLGKKIRLLPTPEQEKLFWQSAGTARWAWNYFLGERKRVYKEYLDNNKTGPKNISSGDVRKQITQLKKTEEYSWLKNVGSNIPKEAIRDADKAFKAFFKGKRNEPKFKSKRKAKPSFYVNYEYLSWKPNGFHGEKIGYVKTAKVLPKLGENQHYSNPRISYDGKHWYLSFCVDQEFESVELTEESIGIDLGLKELAVTYSKYSKTQKFYKNINKSKEVKRLEKKLKREQRKLNRKRLKNTDHYEYVQKEDKKSGGYKPVYKKPLRECKNITRQNRKIKLIYKRLTDIRNNHIHQITAELVKTKPARIVIEDLNVSGMMKNKHLAKAIANQKFYEFRRQLEYKIEKYGITLVKADRYYPSSKNCSCCGHKKVDLKLKDRIYKCDSCGLIIDRDLNAAINLANYKV